MFACHPRRYAHVQKYFCASPWAQRLPLFYMFKPRHFAVLSITSYPCVSVPGTWERKRVLCSCPRTSCTPVVTKGGVCTPKSPPGYATGRHQKLLQGESQCLKCLQLRPHVASASKMCARRLRGPAHRYMMHSCAYLRILSMQ